ncbi:MAG: hypothetical protein IJH13_02130 [Bacilli bacterium]|nr:hypothetical protein [Bacilli bacterium]
MKIKNLRVRAASIGVSLVLAGGYGGAMAMPVFAEDVQEEVEVENNDEIVLAEANMGEEIAVEEIVPEVKEQIKEEVVEEQVPEVKKEEEAKKEEVTKEETTKEDDKSKEKEEVKEPKKGASTPEASEEKREENEPHKVSVITVKVDGEGAALAGATLQIIDSNGNVVDEWISDGKEHISMLPEGTYTLHEAGTPAGYTTSEDKTFTVKVEVNDINAGVVHDDSGTVCWHYGGVPLYYVESEGEREEVYCINQDWKEPHDIDYNGMVLDETNIRTFTPDSDPSMTDQELYDKVLDIIYHRSKAEELFPNLSEIEIRFITEYALKTYTSSEVLAANAKRDEQGHIIRDEDGNIVYEYYRFLRYYRYDPDSPQGYVIDPENGDGFGKLAQHWWTAHNHTKIPDEYAQLFYYLIGTSDKHPKDMHLYIYSTKNLAADGESYQNLLGVRWFDPYDEDYKMYLSVINKAKPYTPPEEPEKPKEQDSPKKQKETTTTPTKTSAKVIDAPQTGDDNSFTWALAGLGSSAMALTALAEMKRRENKKVKRK